MTLSTHPSLSSQVSPAYQCRKERVLLVDQYLRVRCHRRRPHVYKDPTALCYTPIDVAVYECLNFQCLHEAFVVERLT